MSRERVMHFERIMQRRHITFTTIMMMMMMSEEVNNHHQLPEDKEVYDVGDGDNADHLLIVVNHNQPGEHDDYDDDNVDTDDDDGESDADV